LFKPDYNPNINKDQLQDLKLEKPEDVLIYSIVTIHSDPMQTSANLMGPIIINRVKKLGKQIICDDEKYSVKERVLK
jgi:flagellar assembly factor FliW